MQISRRGLWFISNWWDELDDNLANPTLAQLDGKQECCLWRSLPLFLGEPCSKISIAEQGRTNYDLVHCEIKISCIAILRSVFLEPLHEIPKERLPVKLPLVLETPFPKMFAIIFRSEEAVMGMTVKYFGLRRPIPLLEMQ